MYVCARWCLWSLEEGIGYSETRVRGSCEHSDVCWEPNPGLLQKQQVLLIPAPSPGFLWPFCSML